VAKKKKRKSPAKRISFKLGRAKKKKKPKSAGRPRLKGIFKVLASVCVVAAVVIAYRFWEKYLTEAGPISGKAAVLELVGPPSWVNEQLKEKVYLAARSDGEDLRLDDDVARSVQNNLSREVAWLDEVRVQATNESLLIEGRWRKPVALVKQGRRMFYVDAELVVLDYLPMPSLPIVKVVELSATNAAPQPGSVWQHDDLAAAVTILTRLDRMDRLVTPDKPLLYEIDRIDVSNFNGRKNRRATHIVLYTTDDIEIKWGAEYGKWQQYLEATDEEKLAKLYGYYKEYGSLLNTAKDINLCDPQYKIYQPIDKY
jgi:hypothetical protein